MSMSVLKSLIAVLAAAVLTACGGSRGSAAPAPTNLRVEAGEGGVTLYWTGTPGVDYWAYAGQSSTICKNCGNNPNNWSSLIGAQSRGWSSTITSPFFFTGSTIQTSLNNDVLYSFIMDGRINGGPGGDATTPVSATPRLNGQNWYTGGAFDKAGVTSLAFGPAFNPTLNAYSTTPSYLAVGSGGIKYQSADGQSWTSISSADSVNWKGATYALRGLTIQKFIAVGAAGASSYSFDLTNWTSAPSAADVSSSQDLNAVASNTNLVVAVGNNGTIIRSGDGITWSLSNPLPSTPNLYAITYAAVPSGGLWIATGAGGAIFISGDATTWVSVNSGTTQDLKSIAFVVNTTFPNGVYTPTVAPVYSYSVVAVGNAGTVTQSSDGSNWSATTLGNGSNLNAIVASSALIPTNQFMIVGDTGQAFTSPDGVTWTPRNTKVTQNLVGLIRGYNNQYLAWSTNGSSVYSK